MAADRTRVDVVVEMDTDAVAVCPVPDRGLVARFLRVEHLGLLGFLGPLHRWSPRSSPTTHAVADAVTTVRRSSRPAGGTVRSLLRRSWRNGCEMGRARVVENPLSALDVRAGGVRARGLRLGG